METDISIKLTNEFGKGFSVQNLENMRKFYLLYNDDSKSQSVIRILNNQDSTLSWTHYLVLIRIEDSAERAFYQIEAFNNNWSVRELKRQYKTIGIILCKDKSQTLVEITLPENNNQNFASRYKTVIPDKQTFIELLEGVGNGRL